MRGLADEEARRQRGVAVGEGAGAVLAGKVDRRTHAARALVHCRVVRSLVSLLAR